MNDLFWVTRHRLVDDMNWQSKVESDGGGREKREKKGNERKEVHSAATADPLLTSFDRAKSAKRESRTHEAESELTEVERLAKSVKTEAEGCDFRASGLELGAYRISRESKRGQAAWYLSHLRVLA